MSQSVSFVEVSIALNQPMIFVKMYFDSEKDDTIAVAPLVDFRFSKIFQLNNF